MYYVLKHDIKELAAFVMLLQKSFPSAATHPIPHPPTPLPLTPHHTYTHKPRDRSNKYTPAIKKIFFHVYNCNHVILFVCLNLDFKQCSNRFVIILLPDFFFFFLQSSKILTSESISLSSLFLSLLLL